MSRRCYIYIYTHFERMEATDCVRIAYSCSYHHKLYNYFYLWIEFCYITSNIKSRTSNLNAIIYNLNMNARTYYHHTFVFSFDRFWSSKIFPHSSLYVIHVYIYWVPSTHFLLFIIDSFRFIRDVQWFFFSFFRARTSKINIPTCRFIQKYFRFSYFY